MESLAQIFTRHGTDKEINGYTAYYERLFQGLATRAMRIAEIGIGTLIPGVPSSMVGYGEKHYTTGASLRAWRDYFTHENSEIHGFDIQPDTQFSDEPRITTHLLNSTDAVAVRAYCSENPQKWDIIIDDGCHYDCSQLKTVQNLWDSLVDGGYYVVEDIYPSSRLLTEFLEEFNQAIGHAPWLLSTKRNWLVVFKACAPCPKS